MKKNKCYVCSGAKPKHGTCPYCLSNLERCNRRKKPDRRGKHVNKIHNLMYVGYKLKEIIGE